MIPLLQSVSTVNVPITPPLLRCLPLLLLLLLPCTTSTNTCTFTQRPWAPQPLVCIGCRSGYVRDDGTTSSSQSTGTTFHDCIPCKVVLEGCAICGIVQPGLNRPLDCMDSSTSSTAGEWPKPNGTFFKEKIIVIVLSNEGYHPGPIKGMFDKIKHDTSYDSPTASVCGSMSYNGLDLQTVPNFECVCDSTCGDPTDIGEIGRCQSNGLCQRCPDGWSTRGDYTMFTDCVVYEPIQTLSWLLVLFSSLAVVVLALKRSSELLKLRHLWQTYFSTLATADQDHDPDDVPVAVTASLYCQNIFYLVWKHDDGFLLLLALARSVIYVFIVVLPKLAIGGQGTEICFNRLVTGGISLTSVLDCVLLPEVVMFTLTKWIKKHVPRRNPYRLHCILMLHKSFDISYARVRPFFIGIAFGGPWVVLLTNIGYLNGTYGTETRIIPYKDQFTLSIFLSIFIRGQYIALASLQFWLCFICSAKVVYSFGVFASKVKRACRGLGSEADINDGGADSTQHYVNNILNPEKTLEDIRVASAAVKKLAFLMLLCSSCVAGYYAALVVIEPLRQRVSFVVAPIVFVLDIYIFQIIRKIKARPRRLNGHQARRYIKVGEGLSGVTDEEGTFDERVAREHGENDVAGDGAGGAGGSGGSAADDLEDEDELSVCACCYSKAYKAQKRREQKKKRRDALRRRKQEHLFLQQTSSKVHPLDNAPTENPSLYDTYNIDAKLRRKFRKEFQKIDKDNSKSISFDEFVGYYQIRENASFVRRLFLSFQHNDQEGRVMEEGRKNTEEELVLHFQDFVLGVRNFLVMTKGQVIVKTFDMYDDDGSKSLDISELKEMVMDIWGQNASTEHSRIGYIIKHMDPDGSGETDMDEWMASCKKNPVLMKPAFNSQRVLREKCFGLKFWIEQQRIAVEKMQEKKKAGK